MTTLSNLPQNIHSYIDTFDALLSDEEFSSPRYAYRILFVPKTANHRGQADRVIEFVKSSDPLTHAVNKEYVIFKETEKTKYLPKQIVELMNAEGYPYFSIRDHTLLWQSLDAKNPAKGYGTLIAGEKWHWYESWVEVVRKYCRENRQRFSYT